MITKARKHIVKRVFELTNENVTKKVPMLNYGGCGIIAEHLYRIFTNMGLKPEIKLLIKPHLVDYYKDYFDTIKKNNITNVVNFKKFDSRYEIPGVSSYYHKSMRLLY